MSSQQIATLIVNGLRKGPAGFEFSEFTLATLPAANILDRQAVIVSDGSATGGAAYYVSVGGTWVVVGPTDLTGVQADIAANSAAIATNTAASAANTSAITGLDTRVTTNEADIASNSAAIATNATSAAANTSAITGLDTRVTTNEADIAALQASPALTFKGCRLEKILSPQTFNFGTIAKVTWNDEKYDNGDWFDSAVSDTDIIVPAGVTRVHVDAWITWDTDATGDRQLKIAIGNASQAFVSGPAGGLSKTMQVASATFAVSPGDDINIRALQNGPSILNLRQGECFVSVTALG